MGGKKDEDDDIIAVDFDYEQDKNWRKLNTEDIPEEEPGEEGTGS